VKRARIWPGYCRSAILSAIVVCLSSEAAFAKKSSLERQLSRLDGLLTSNDLAAAETLATAIYQQSLNPPALQSPDPSVIIDPAMVAESVGFVREKAACQIAEVYYKHAELAPAKQWAQAAALNGTLTNQYVRRATVLLGDIAMAMDQDDAAVSNYVAVITLKNNYREQPEAYAHLFELLMLAKHDDLVEQWVRHGQAKFEGEGGLEMEFLRQAAKTLKRRNHPLWNELDSQIAELDGKGKLQALRELASNARKFGRWAEAETNYAAICAMPPKSPEETVNTHLFLAECQAKQSKDFVRSLQELQTKAAAFTNATDREYAAYRVAKFSEEHGELNDASTFYTSLSDGSSTSIWAAAALHQLAALKERQGDLQGALQLYLQYPRRFPQRAQLVMQAYGAALSVAATLGDTNAANKISSTITSRATTIQDYNTHLNLAWHYGENGNSELAQRFLEDGLNKAAQTLALTYDPDARIVIHHRVLRRLSSFGRDQRVLAYWQQYQAELSSGSKATTFERAECGMTRVLALQATGSRTQATSLAESIFNASENDSTVAPMLAYYVCRLLEPSQSQTSNSDLAEWLDVNYPVAAWSNAVRLSRAKKAVAAGSYDQAKLLLRKIIASADDRSKAAWIRDTAAKAKELYETLPQAAEPVR
jgi:hypothetical protein